MNTSPLCRFLFLVCLVITLPAATSAKQLAASISDLPDFAVITITDSTSKKPPVKPDDKKEEIKKPEIKEIPKSKRHIKPMAVGARIKMKIPVKIKPMIKTHMRVIIHH